jgi:hypothetical protein
MALRCLFADLWQRMPEFNPRAIHVGFVIDKVGLGQGFPWVLRFSPASIIQPVSLHSLIDSFIHLRHRRYTTLALNSLFNHYVCLYIFIYTYALYIYIYAHSYAHAS